MNTSSHDIRQLEDFLRWFLDLEVIPAETKAVFIKHLLETGYFDEVAQEYVAILMEYLSALASYEAQEAKKRLEEIQKEIEKENNPRTSLRARVVAEKIQKMHSLSDAFRKSLLQAESEAIENTQQKEKNIEKEKISSLKKKLQK